MTIIGGSEGPTPPMLGSSQNVMPGMATDEELEARTATTGTQADDRCFALMLPDHRGRAEMGEAGLEQTEDPEVQLLAEGTRQARASEIATLPATCRHLRLPSVPDRGGGHG